MRNTEFFISKKIVCKRSFFFFKKKTDKGKANQRESSKIHTFNKGKKRETKETTEIKEREQKKENVHKHKGIKKRKLFWKKQDKEKGQTCKNK